VVALHGAGQIPRLALHRQGVALDEVLDEAVVAQLVRRFVQRVDGAIGEAENEKQHQDGND
jgi:hypothetical protein